MKHLFIAMLLSISSCVWGINCPADQSKNGAALVEIEHRWARALDSHQVQAVGCILAEEFQDADTEGKLRNRSETLAAVPHRRPGTDTLSELEPHVFGDFGYIRGLATLTDSQGKTVGRVRFTDVYLYRGGRWLAVAGQETLLPEGPK
jgi:ketosteroid isomerase-like protein